MRDANPESADNENKLSANRVPVPRQRTINQLKGIGMLEANFHALRPEIAEPGQQQSCADSRLHAKVEEKIEFVEAVTSTRTRALHPRIFNRSGAYRICQSKTVASQSLQRAHRTVPMAEDYIAATSPNGTYAKPTTKQTTARSCRSDARLQSRSQINL